LSPAAVSCASSIRQEQNNQLKLDVELLAQFTNALGCGEVLLALLNHPTLPDTPGEKSAADGKRIDAFGPLLSRKPEFPE
jgi:hypothetical protein